MEDIIYHPIGLIHTPFKEPKGTPIQPRRGRGIQGTIEVYPEYAEGLADLDGFSHIIVLYHLHLSKEYSLKVTPFLDNQPRGVFATHAPRRPNPIGVSVVRLKKVEGNILHIEDIDMVDGTPLLDLKPFVPEFEKNKEPEKYEIGWLKGKIHGADTTDADERMYKK